MYKKLLFSLVLMVIGFSTSFAQQELMVYDGNATSTYVPVYGFYADAFTKVEFVMNSDDLSPMTGGAITGMTWYLVEPAGKVWGGRFQIFVKEVSFSSISTFNGMDGATIVYDGPLDATSGVLKIDFTAPYVYEGDNLLVGVYGVETGQYSGAAFLGVSAPGAAVQNYSYTSLDVITSPNQRDFLPKTTFTYTSSGSVVYYKPTNLQVTDIATNGATITWTPGSDETSWNVEYKKHSEEEWTSAGSVTEPAIVLDVLHNGTPYDVRVQADYGDGNLSSWTTTMFTTLYCDAEDMGEITYVLNDSYGDGWNGNKLQIVYHSTGTVVTELTIPSASNHAEGSVSLCYGVEYDLVWVTGSYVSETSSQVFNCDGSIIFEHDGPNGVIPQAGILTTFMLARETCPRPSNLEASNVVYNGATLTWTPGAEDQDMWQVVCGTGRFNPDGAEPITVNGEPTVQLNGLMENTTYEAYVRSACTPNDMSIWVGPCTFTTPLRFPLPTDLAVNKITAKSAEATWNGDAETYNLRYRVKTNMDESFEAAEAPTGWTCNDWVLFPISEYNMGGTPLNAAEGNNCMGSISIDEDSGSALGVDNWLISPKVNLGGTLTLYACDLGTDYVENYSVYVSTSGTDAEDFVALGENIQTPGGINQWGAQTFDLSAYAGQQGYIAIRHHDSQGYYLFIDAVSIDGEGIAAEEWTVMEGVTSPVTMEPLAASTTYEVQVQGVYPDGESAWTQAVNFTTLPADAMPTNLEVINVTATTAEATWIGSQDVYNLRYRKAAILNGVTEDFTGVPNGSLPEGWTYIDSDGDGQNWYVWVLNLEDGTQQITLSSNSYLNNYGPLYPDNWIITPQITLGNVLRFDAWGQDAGYPAEHFQVYVSTTGTDVADFVPVSEEIVTTGEKTNYEFDLSEYVGQMGYVALRHFNVSDQYILNVTNFYLAGEEDDIPAGDWIVVNNVTPPYTMQGLEPETAYEVEVQGILPGRATTEWTAPVPFVTLEQGDEPILEPTEAPGARTWSGVNGNHTQYVEFTAPEDNCEMQYRYKFDDGDWSEWMTYDEVLAFTANGTYEVEGRARAAGKDWSEATNVPFIITPRTGINEVSDGKAVASVRYFNALGQEMPQADGVTIVVTTYTDGTTSSVKVIK